MRLEDDQYEEIKHTVIDTFLEYDIKCIPISAFEMAVKMGLTVIPYSALSAEQIDASMQFSEDGYSVETLDNEWIIYYNDSCRNYGRINQTIMHEIGHYIMGHTTGTPEEEAEAKFFAKYALAPPPLIHNMLKPITQDAIEEKFCISHEAARYAFAYYNNWLKYGEIDYTEYEMKMLELFHVA